MISFFVALILLIVGYFLYSKRIELIFGIDDRETPAIAIHDGVDNIPLPKWKAFLIELLNIAGTGPIFGAIAGALFGPIVFIWIVIGCIFGGAVHDYMTGMISSRHGGHSIPSISKIYLGKEFSVILRIFSVILLILVTAVFVVSPSSLLETLTNGHIKAIIWMTIILVYYFVATILPIDKVIGKAYPVFGIILILMALFTIFGIIFNQGTYPMLELTNNLRDLSQQNGDLPWWPFMLMTVACGAISGFHATQSPMMARCIKSEKDGRFVFYFAMIAEGIIALIWAAAAMAFYHVDTAEGFQNLAHIGGNSTSVYEICHTLLGPVGTILAIVGVVICPITSGDTALRSTRLIIGEAINLDQKKIKNRIILTIPLFVMVILLAIWNFLDSTNFNILWHWFAWSNQTLAAIALWFVTTYIYKNSKKKIRILYTIIPAYIMTVAIITYIFLEPNIALGKYISRPLGIILGIVLGTIYLIFFLIRMFYINKKKKTQI